MCLNYLLDRLALRQTAYVIKNILKIGKLQMFCPQDGHTVEIGKNASITGGNIAGM